MPLPPRPSPLSSPPPTVAPFLFAVHPVHTEAVTWIAGLPDLSFAFLFLLSFYLYMPPAGGKPASAWSYPLSVVSFFLAALCKEPALTLPAVLIAYDWLIRKEKDGLPARLTRYVPYFLAAGIYLLLRYRALGGFAPSFRRHAYLSPYQYVVNTFPLFTQHLEKLLLPANLNAFHVFHPISSILEPKGLATLAATAAFLLLAFLLIRWNRVSAFGLLWIAIPLFPVLHIPSLGDNTFAERYLYLPSFGFVLLLSLAVPRLAKTDGGTAVAAILLVSLAGLYSVGTVARNRVWMDNYTLFSDTVKKSPDASIPHNMLGTALAIQRRTDESMRHFRIAVDLDPTNPGAQSNLGFAYLEAGELRRAVDHLEASVRLDPFNAMYRNNLALAHFLLGQEMSNAGRADETLEHFRAAVRFRPNDDAYRNMLGITLARKGLHDEAIEQFQAALRIAPEEPAYRQNLDRATGMKDRSGMR